ncbi:MAG: NAD-dependent epimerase/dehydratase family protein [Parvibaculales bacterium]
MTPSGKNILITGATGFVGSHIANTLKEEGFRVFATTRQTVTDSGDVHWLNVKHDTKNQLAEFLKNTPTAAIVHAAGLINGSNSAITESNEGFTADLIAAIEDAQVNPDFYFLSSVSAINETSAYGKSKAACEKLIHEKVKGRYVILRSSLIFGPGDSKNVAMITAIIRRTRILPIPGGQSVKLQPLYVADLSQAILSLLNGKGKNGKVYLISGPKQEKLFYMVQEIQKQLGKRCLNIPFPLFLLRWPISMLNAMLPFLKLPVQQVRDLHDHPMYSISDASRDLDFQPRTFREGLQDYLK